MGESLVFYSVSQVATQLALPETIILRLSRQFNIPATPPTPLYFTDTDFAALTQIQAMLVQGHSMQAVKQAFAAHQQLESIELASKSTAPPLQPLQKIARRVARPKYHRHHQAFSTPPAAVSEPPVLTVDAQLLPQDLHRHILNVRTTMLQALSRR